MDTQKTIEYYEDLDYDGNFEGKRPGHHRIQYHERQRVTEAERRFITGQDLTSQGTFSFTYKPARFEEGWLYDSLGPLYEQQWISDVLRKIKGGKEASVYLCRSGAHVTAPLVAAKVYRPRMLRNLKNDNLYRADRQVLDEDGHVIHDLGMLKAHIKRTHYGEQIRHQSWIAYEYRTLQTLHACGADVPQPFEMTANAILMGYIGGEDHAAPTLNTAHLNPGEIHPLFDRLIRNVDLMLDNGIIHADLSAYNVLYWQGRITLIDFPQIISPTGHRAAWRIFNRDIARSCEYFARQGLLMNPSHLAKDLWSKHGFPIRPELISNLDD